MSVHPLGNIINTRKLREAITDLCRQRAQIGEVIESLNQVLVTLDGAQKPVEPVPES